LFQNSPNPFNPTTTIRFQIPETGSVTLKVFDMLGREIATLVNQTMNAGRYVATFDATGLAGGLYLYRLQVGDVALTRKLVVLR
jgi:hypothetical protein